MIHTNTEINSENIILLRKPYTRKHVLMIPNRLSSATGSTNLQQKLSETAAVMGRIKANKDMVKNFSEILPLPKKVLLS